MGCASNREKGGCERSSRARSWHCLAHGAACSWMPTLFFCLCDALGSFACRRATRLCASSLLGTTPRSLPSRKNTTTTTTVSVSSSWQLHGSVDGSSDLFLQK